jgi:small-conductance mechanosensitive channel
MAGVGPTATDLLSLISISHQDAAPSPGGSVLWGIVATAAATLVLAVVILAAQALRRRLRRAVVPGARRAGRGLIVGQVTLIDSRRLATLVAGLIDATLWGLVAVTLYGYLTYVLGRFDATRDVATGLGGALVQAARGLGLGALALVPRLVAILLIVLVIRILARGADALFDAAERGTVELPWIHPDVVRPTRKLVTIGLWILGAVLIYPLVPGSGSEAFRGVSIFVGLLVSLGSTGLVGNAMGGLVLMYSRALKPGDVVQVQETTGKVLELGMLATRILTPRGIEVTIPNTVMIGHPVANYSRRDDAGGAVLHTSVTIGYDAPWRQVHRLLLGAAAATANLRKDPAPYVLQAALNDSSVAYTINAHLEDPFLMPATLSALHAAIQDQFNAAGVEILSPTFRVQRTQPEDTTIPHDRWEG